MRAILVREFGGPEVLRVEEIDDPVAGPGEVLVRLEAAGINPVDTYVRSGVYERLPELPYVPGGDGAGMLAAVGQGVSRFREGERVYIAGAAGGALTGCYATLVAKPEAAVHPLPEKASFEQGAAVGVPYATAYRALVHKGKARPGETVLVHGASGGVGLAAVQLAAERGLRVVGTASTEEGRERVAAQGAELVLDHSEDGYLDTLTEWTEGRGADVVLEMAAHVNLDRDLDAAARGGRIVVIGCRGPVEIYPRKAMVKDLTIRAFALATATAAEMAETHGALVEGLRSGALDPVVARTFPLDNAPEAHRTMADARGAQGKIVLIP
ncbi:MAG: NADPH:quinone reductase [Holophagales bacterium]|nr:NADPH:quinone reductase [Holophagales bacterium]